RRTEGGADAKKAMNDPAATKPRRALRCHFPDMIHALAEYANAYKATLHHIKLKTNELIMSDGKSVPFDKLILTIPLWVIRDVAPFDVPQGMAMRLNLVDVIPVRDRYAKWDYVYTPYTPANQVHRFSPRGRAYSVEVNGEMDRDSLESDLNFIFDEGYEVE